MNAFEITQEDVNTVLSAHNIVKTPKERERIFDDLDCGEIEGAALYGDEMEEQTNYAYQEIENQLKAEGILPSMTPTKFSNV